jgi:hypothetical protein
MKITCQLVKHHYWEPVRVRENVRAITGGPIVAGPQEKDFTIDWRCKRCAATTSTPGGTKPQS